MDNTAFNTRDAAWPLDDRAFDEDMLAVVWEHAGREAWDKTRESTWDSTEDSTYIAVFVAKRAEL